MKKLIFLFVLISNLNFTSCSIESNNTIPVTKFMPIESVEIPEYFIHGETHEIFLTYNKPNSCYVFNNIIFDINQNERTVAILNTVYDNSNCTTLNELETVSFELTVLSTDTYLFKFYQGNENGIDSYHLVEVPVEVQ